MKNTKQNKREVASFKNKIAKHGLPSQMKLQASRIRNTAGPKTTNRRQNASERLGQPKRPNSQYTLPPC